MNEKKIEPTQAMVDIVDLADKLMVVDTRDLLRYALNHPDAPGLFAGEDATDARPWEPLIESDQVCVGDEVRQDHLGVTTIAVVGRVDGEGDPWTAEDRFIGGLDLGTWYVRRAIQELPTEDGVEIVPAGGGPIGAAHPGGKFTTHHATYDSYLGSWVGVWRAASGRVTVSSVSPGDITPGTWKVEGE